MVDLAALRVNARSTKDIGRKHSLHMVELLWRKRQSIESLQTWSTVVTSCSGTAKQYKNGLDCPKMSLNHKVFFFFFISIDYIIESKPNMEKKQN